MGEKTSWTIVAKKKAVIVRHTDQQCPPKQAEMLLYVAARPVRREGALPRRSLASKQKYLRVAYASQEHSSSYSREKICPVHLVLYEAPNGKHV